MTLSEVNSLFTPRHTNLLPKQSLVYQQKFILPPPAPLVLRCLDMTMSSIVVP